MKNLLLVKAKAVLEAVSTAREPVALNELAKSLQMPLPTLSRLTSDLVEMGLIDKADYHHLVPGLSMLRLAACAKQNLPLLKQAIPLCSRFAEKYKMSFLLAGIEQKTVFSIHANSAAFSGNSALWSCGIATLLLATSGKKIDEANALYMTAFPNADITEKLIFEREFENALQQKYLFKINTMRLWSLSMPFYYRGTGCAICFAGNAPGNIAPERFIFECAKLVARLNNLTEADE